MNLEQLRIYSGKAVAVYPELTAVLRQLDSAHGTQLYGWAPYIYHLVHTASLGAGYGFDSLTWQKVFLYHDSLEDTDITLEQLREEHGSAVADCVHAVTGCNGNRAEHWAAQRAKITALPRAAIVKTCDRLSHWLNLAENYPQDPVKNGRLIRMYSKEAEEFESFMAGKVPEEMLSALVNARQRALLRLGG